MGHGGVGGCRLSQALPLQLTYYVLLPRLRRRYVNALEAASENFASNIDREMLRGEEELDGRLQDKNRHSNSGSLLSYFFFSGIASTYASN